MFNSNMWPNLTPSGNIRLRDLRGLDFDPSRSFRVKCNCAIGLHTYDVLLMYNSKHMSILHRLAITTAEKCFSYNL